MSDQTANAPTCTAASGAIDLLIEPKARDLGGFSVRRVLLDAWRVSRFTGEPRGREGQQVRWVAAAELGCLEFPEANRAIVAALSRPPS